MRNRIGMNQFTSRHKQRERVVAQFMSFTQSSEKNALHFLSQHDWKLDLAVDAYYLSLDSGPNSRRNELQRMNSTSNSNVVDRKKLDQIWNSYKGKFIRFYGYLTISSQFYLNF